MRYKIATAPLIAALSVGITGTALAEESLTSIGGKISLLGNVGYSSYSMADWNEHIDRINYYNDGTNHSRADLAKITGGTAIGGGIQYAVIDNFLIGADVEYLMAGSEGEVSYTFDIHPEANFTEHLVFKLPALGLGGFIKGAITLNENILVTGGFGIQHITLAGKYENAERTDSGEEFHTDLTGSGIGFKIMAGGEYFINKMISFGIDAGYRIAKINEVHMKVTDNLGNKIDFVLYKDENTKSTTDYSGLILQGVVRFYF